MGNSASSNQSRQDKQKVQVIKAMSNGYIKKEIEAIDEFKNILAFSNINSTNKNKLDILRHSTTRLLDIMKKQLERDDKALVKADIIAIIISLKPDLALDINNLDNFTVKQLNTMLRTILYDINRIKKEFNINIKAIDDVLKPQSQPQLEYSFPTVQSKPEKKQLTYNVPKSLSPERMMLM
jgi:hypothetical protein